MRSPLSVDPFDEQSRLLSRSVQEEHQQKESKNIDHIGVKPAVVHAREESGDPSRGGAHGLQEQAVHHMRFLALPVDGGAEMHRDCLSGVLRDVGLKDRLEYHSHRIGKSRRSVSHLWQKPGNSACPERTPRHRTPSRQPSHDKPRQQQQNRKSNDAVGRRHGKYHRVCFLTAQ